jgi:hypothetical protein
LREKPSLRRETISLLSFQGETIPVFLREKPSLGEKPSPYFQGETIPGRTTVS